MKSKQNPATERGELANRLAILSNQLGGADEAETVLNIPMELIQKSINGGYLTGYELALAQNAVNRFRLEPEIADEWGIDPDEVDTIADEMLLAGNFIADIELENKFRQLVGDNSIKQHQIEKATNLFANLETRRVRTILEGITDINEINRDRLSKNANRLNDKGKLSNVKLYKVISDLDDIENLTRSDAINYLRSLPVPTRGRYKDKPLLSAWQEKQLLQGITNAPDLDAMFVAFDGDEQDIWNIEESLFWAWFREMFYGD